MPAAPLTGKQELPDRAERGPGGRSMSMDSNDRSQTFGAPPENRSGSRPTTDQWDAIQQELDEPGRVDV